LENSFAALQDNGIMWMDDYDNQTRETFENFLTKYRGHYDIIHKGYQLAIQKKNPIFLMADNSYSIQQTNTFIYELYMAIKNKSTTIFYIANNKINFYHDFQGNVHYVNEKNLSEPQKTPGRTYNAFLLSNEPVLLDNQVSPFIYGKSYLHLMGISNVDMLHIDMEEYEMNILQSFEKDISSIKYILINYTGTVEKLNMIKNYLKYVGFSHFSCLTVYGAEIIKTFFTPCIFLCINKKYAPP